MYLTANDDVIAGGVDGKAGDAAPGKQLLGKGLLGQVVDANMVLRGHEEEGFGRVEGHAHHAAPVLSERILAHFLRQLVNQHRLQHTPAHTSSHTGCAGHTKRA